MESLKRRLTTLKSQLKQYEIKAPFSGSIDDIPVRVGEMAQPGVPLLRLVNPRDMYIMADVSEAFLGKFSPGDQAEVYFPIKDKRFKSAINSVSKVINDQNRTFTIEVQLPATAAFEFQPNQVAILKLTDYQKEDAIAVPSKLIQTDDQGKFVYVIGKQQGSDVAKKARVKTGMTYNSMTEILGGLDGNELVIERGYRDVNEGVEIKLASL
jgi:RND family efflux transporter MFP subunit